MSHRRHATHFWTGGKIVEVIKGAAAGVAEDITHNKAMKGIGKYNPKSLPQATPKNRSEIPIRPDMVIKPNPKKIRQRFLEEEAAGISRGPRAWGKKQ